VSAPSLAVTGEPVEVRVVDGRPGGIAFDGAHLWVTNSTGASNLVTEFNASDGSWVRVGFSIDGHSDEVWRLAFNAGPLPVGVA
jgi:hypothetical protein